MSTSVPRGVSVVVQAGPVPLLPAELERVLERLRRVQRLRERPRLRLPLPEAPPHAPAPAQEPQRGVLTIVVLDP
jgi:hypothetical protein